MKQVLSCNSPKIVNLVATTKSKEFLNLDEISTRMPKVIYEPSIFPGLTCRIVYPPSTLIIFASGKITTTGCKSMKHAMDSIHSTVLLIEKILGKKLTLEPIKIVNAVSVTKLDQKIDLGRMVKIYPKSKFDPDSFPAVFLYLENSVRVLIFASGKLVCVGTKSEKEAINTLNKISEKLLGSLI